MKKCFKCGENKELEDFYKHPRMADGRLNKCKECTKRDVAENYVDKREYYAEYERKRFQNPDRKKQVLQYQRNRRMRNPERTKAAYLTSNAIRDGRLTRKPCEVCGAEKVEAHHEDYSKPLEVRWLCRKHHLEHHGKKAYED